MPCPGPTARAPRPGPRTSAAAGAPAGFRTRRRRRATKPFFLVATGSRAEAVGRDDVHCQRPVRTEDFGFGEPGRFAVRPHLYRAAPSWKRRSLLASSTRVEDVLSKGVDLKRCPLGAVPFASAATRDAERWRPKDGRHQLGRGVVAGESRSRAHTGDVVVTP